MYKKVLVTGGTGFIGSHLVEALLSQGRSVYVLALPKPFEPIESENQEIIKNKGAKIVYGDLKDIESLKSVVPDIDCVFHLGAISRPMNIPKQEYYDTNVLGTKNILEVTRGKKLKKFVHASTVSVLGVSPDGVPLKENDFQEETAHYGLSKRAGEKVVLDYHQKYGVPAIVIRPCLVYGPRCLVRLVMFRFVKLGIFPLFNKGRARMEFCYVDNVIQALLLAEARDDLIGEVFNITDGQSYEIKTVLDTIATELNVREPLIHLPVSVGKVLGYLMEGISSFIGIHPSFSSTAADWMSKSQNVYDCTKAKKILNYAPKVSLDHGVRASIKWYKKKNLL